MARNLIQRQQKRGKRRQKESGGHLGETEEDCGQKRKGGKRRGLDL